MALLDESGLKYLWSQLKTKFAMASHTHDAATKSTAGMMSAADKTKLDGIAEKANNYSHPTSAGNKHIPAGGSAGKILGWASDGTAQWVDDKNTTYREPPVLQLVALVLYQLLRLADRAHST